MREYASTNGTIYPAGAFAGSLFIGKYSWNDKTESITPGHAFSSRPSALKFYYNYVPKNTDTFKAYVELKNGEEFVGSGTFISSTSNEGWAEATVTREYVDQPKEANFNLCTYFYQRQRPLFQKVILIKIRE